MLGPQQGAQMSNGGHKEKEASPPSSATLARLLQILMWIMAPFCVIWLVAMTVVFFQESPWILLLYPIAGIGVLGYRYAAKKPSRDSQGGPDPRMEAGAAAADDGEGRGTE
jgi:hypothetical protein